MEQYSKRFLLLAASLFCVNLILAQTVVSLQLSKDALILSHNPTANYGAHNTMIVYSNSNGLRYRSVLQADLSSLPSDAIISSAKLYLKKADNNSANIVLERLSADWQEMQITYSNQPGVEPGSTTTSTIAENGDFIFDVTTDVVNMLNGIHNNYGWLMRVFDEQVYQYKSFYSRDYSNIAYRPYIEVTYTLPLSISNAVISHASDQSSSNGSITPTVTGGSGNYSYEWINGNTGSVIHNGASVVGLTFGWYGLHVTDNLTNQELYMAFIVATEQCHVNIDFKPGPDYIDDAMIYNLTKNGIDYGDYNYGNYSLLRSEKWTSGAWYDMKSLLKFNLWMDQDLNVDLADLSLYGIDHYPLSRPNDSEFRKITDAWDESSVTFNTAPSISSTPLEQLAGTPQGNEDKTVDMRDFWNEWKLNNNQNYGVMFQLQSYANSYTRMRYYSADHTDPLKRPWIRFRLNKGPCENHFFYLKKSVEESIAYIVGDLKFKFEEDYFDNNETLEFEIQDINGSGIAPINGTLTKTLGVDFYTIDISSSGYNLSSGNVYLITVTNEKGLKSYLKFKVA